MKTIAVIVRNKQKGLYASMGLQLMAKAHVIFIVDNNDTARIIRQICGDEQPSILFEPDYRDLPEPRSTTVNSAADREKKYNVRYFQLISMDRALGRGYQLNIDAYPWIKRANWKRENKLEILNKKFEFFETSLESVDILISQFPEVVPNTVCDNFGIKHFHLLQARFGERLIWSDTSYFVSSSYIECLNKYLRLTAESLNCLDNIEYQLDYGGTKLLDEVARSFSLYVCLKDMALYIWWKIKLLLLGRGKQNSYEFPGLFPVLLRRRKHYLYLKKYNITPTNVPDGKLAYFPLHMEPELALLQFTNEFNNVFEAISWISKALPADAILIVKDNPKTLGHRDLNFYKKISAMSNVFLSSPDVPSQEWIEKSSFVVTMAGTAGEEAVHYEKPVITFGQRQIINHLPSILVAKTYEDVTLAIESIFSRDISEEQLRLARIAFGNATKEVSFELHGYVDNYFSQRIDLARSQIALDNLRTRFPDFCL